MVLTHLNGDMNRINKRLVKAMLKQAQDQMPDVPPVPVDSDVNQNYLSLMKSLTTILLSLREMYAYRFGLIPEGEADFEYDLPDLPEGFGEEGSEFSGLQSQASQMSYANPFGSQASVASSGQPFYRRGSPQASIYSQPQSSVYSQPQGPQSVYSQPQSTVGKPSTRWEGLSQLSEPTRDEQRIQENIDIANAGANSVMLNSLTREVVNCQFLVEELPFNQLSKIQKQKLKVIIVKIDKVKRVISVGTAKPIYIKLNKILSDIASSLTSEGSASEFIPRTEGEIASVEGDALIGYGRKHRMLSPSMYNAHNYDPYNVNCNFKYNQSKRNI
jgi:hypothetical protein